MPTRRPCWSRASNPGFCDKPTQNSDLSLDEAEKNQYSESQFGNEVAMRSVVRVSEAANLAVHAMAWMAVHGAVVASGEAGNEGGSASGGRVGRGGSFSAAELGEALGVSASHLAKVLQGLAHKGLVRSVRGAKGGFSLAKAPEQTTLLEIVVAVDGAFEPAGCLLGNPICEPGKCKLGPLHVQVAEIVIRELGSITLGSFVTGSGVRHGGHSSTSETV